MEFMVSIYPLAKFIAIALVFLIIILLIKNKHYKSALALWLIWNMFLIFSPIKIDGTNTKTAHSIEIREADSYHRSTALNEENVKVETPEISFEEKMKLEAARSANEIKNIQDGL